MARKKHKNKEIEAAIKYAEAAGWELIPATGHPFGTLKCPYNDKDCRCGIHCISSVWCTPRDNDVHAKQIRRVVDNCTKKPKV